MLNELQHLFGIMSRFCYSLLLFGKDISGINNEVKGKSVPGIFILAVFAFLREAHKYCRAEIVQFRVEIIFNG